MGSNLGLDVETKSSDREVYAAKIEIKTKNRGNTQKVRCRVEG